MTRIGTDIDEAVAVLRAGGLVGLPTETVYGLAADASSASAVRRVFVAKGRPVDHPLIVHVADATALERWAVEVPDSATALIDRWWPGPLTILLRRSSAVLDDVTGGRDTVALRSPAHPMAQAVLSSFGGGLVAPSANRFGRVSPTRAEHVVDELGEAVDLVLDGGPCRIGIESTIVDLSGPIPRLLRAGHITADQLGGLLPDLEVAGGDAPAVAPGMLASHYAPNARVVVLHADAGAAQVDAAARPHLAAGRRVGLLSPGPIAPVAADIVLLDPAGPADDYARVLYSRLRQADELGLDVLIVVPPPAVGSGIAVADRLRRAAHRS
ncbi:MAG: threonylcarbamoyl-AMP synthase [Acidimicrobiia bacterium]|nr:threonylcarbamoyl-AMP synthase [Acidimicrobiia bacterium]